MLNELECSINTFKNFFEKINEKKANLKLEIQKIFTKIRNNLNEREDQLLSENDKEYDNKYFKEDIIKKNQKILNEIKNWNDMGKNIEKEWNNDNKLNLLINNCIIIENNLKTINDDINIIRENQKKVFNEIFFKYNLNTILDDIKKFGKFEFFTKLEYIESLGNQYIDTKVEFTDEYNYSIDFALSSLISYDTKFFGIDNDPKVFVGTIQSKFRFYYCGEKLIDFDTNRHTCTIGKI